MASFFPHPLFTSFTEWKRYNKTDTELRKKMYDVQNVKIIFQSKRAHITPFHCTFNVSSFWEENEKIIIVSYELCNKKMKSSLHLCAHWPREEARVCLCRCVSAMEIWWWRKGKKTCSHWKIKFSSQVFCSFTSGFVFFFWFVTQVCQALNLLSIVSLVLIWWFKRCYVNYLCVCTEPDDELVFTPRFPRTDLRTPAFHSNNKFQCNKTKTAQKFL